MDVVINFPGIWAPALVDVSMRCPHGARYSNASSRPAAAARDGEVEKGPFYGQEVLPLIFETYGRLGPASVNTLSVLADMAASAGGASTRRLQGWRRQLERAVVWSAAESVLLAYGASSHNAGFSCARPVQ